MFMVGKCGKMLVVGSIIPTNDQHSPEHPANGMSSAFRIVYKTREQTADSHLGCQLIL
jgi:hypothetical protein